MSAAGTSRRIPPHSPGRQTPAPPPPDPERTCRNGHAVHQGDLLCPVCGADVGGELPPPVAADATVIDGWELGRRLTSTSTTRERFLARREADGRQAVLTLYRAGAEPDRSVYEVIRRLPRDHVPEIIATGRWEGQAYEVAEELTGGTLADLGHVTASIETVRRIADELGRALNAFSEAGLRHRTFARAPSWFAPVNRLTWSSPVSARPASLSTISTSCRRLKPIVTWRPRPSQGA